MIKSILISNKINNKQNVPFGTIAREVITNDGKVAYRNDTRMFREDLNWKFLINYIESQKLPQKIYCYACSDGSEPYSIALSIIKHFGIEKAKKFFPIIAKDKDYKMIQNAKQRKICLDSTDITRIKNYQNPIPFFPTKLVYKMKTYYNEEEKPIPYIVNKSLADCVDFAEGNIFDDIENINYKNSIIFFRNVWPYLSEKDNEKLLNIFEKKFRSSTSLVVGFFDEASDYKNGESFKDKLYSKNFYQIRPKIYKKWCPDEEKITLKNISKSMCDEFKNIGYNCCEYFRGLFSFFAK